ARSLRVSKPKKHETLESTWKTITDGRHIPLNRHLKKSDTFENHNQDEPKLEYNVMKNLETFNDRTDRVLASRKLRKEGSPSQNELNRRVEAFIKKFNDEMRLQRQESLQRYMDMMNRGAE
ncbi:CFE protein, partial [Tanacetum coccineum]